MLALTIGLDRLHFAAAQAGGGRTISDVAALWSSENTAGVTTAGGNVSVLAPLYGTGNMEQATFNEQPTHTDDGANSLMVFDGNNDVLVSTTTYDLGGVFTISVRAKQDAAETGNQAVISLKSTSDHYIEMRYYNGGFRTAISDGTTSINYDNASATRTNDAVYTVTGDMAADEVKIFEDGVQIGSTASFGAITGDFNNLTAYVGLGFDALRPLAGSVYGAAIDTALDLQSEVEQALNANPNDATGIWSVAGSNWSVESNWEV